ncbi:MAG: hypothetical protein IKJ78_07125 [Bacteroidales bacterium]|nr:hypothetical protein [Bacteroidales bacterium]
MRKNKDKTLDVELLVGSLQRRSAAGRYAVPTADGIESWYQATHRREVGKTVAYALVAGVAAVVLLLALLPSAQYAYMEGAGADRAQEVCLNLHNLLEDA